MFWNLFHHHFNDSWQLYYLVRSTDILKLLNVHRQIICNSGFGLVTFQFIEPVSICIYEWIMFVYFVGNIIGKWFKIWRCHLLQKHVRMVTKTFKRYTLKMPLFNVVHFFFVHRKPISLASGSYSRNIFFTNFINFTFVSAGVFCWSGMHDVGYVCIFHRFLR